MHRRSFLRPATAAIPTVGLHDFLAAQAHPRHPPRRGSNLDDSLIQSAHAEALMRRCSFTTFRLRSFFV